MSELLKSLVDQRVRAVEAMREISSRAVNGEERAEDEASYTKVNEDIDRYGKLIHDEMRANAEDKEYAEALEASHRSMGQREQDKPEARQDEPSLRKQLAEAIAAENATRGALAYRMPDPSETIYRDAYGRNALVERRTVLSTGGSTTGAELVPTKLVNRLFAKLFDDSTILQAGVTVLRTSSGEPLKFPRKTSRGALSQSDARVAELGPILKANPLFDQVTLNAYKYGEIEQYSRELAADGVVDIESIVGENLGENMANYLGIDLTNGDGSGKPRGVMKVVTDTTGNLVTGANSVAGVIQTMDQVLTLIYKLKPSYRRNAKFLMNDTTVLTFRNMKIATEANHYAWQPSLTAGAPDTLFGYPVLTDPNIAAQAAGAVSIAFADFSKYYVRLVGDVRVEWSTEYAWDTDLISVKGILRADADAIDDGAFAGFKGGTA